MEISIQIFDEVGNILAQRTTHSWEVAEQNLQSLKNNFENKREEVEEN